MRLLLISALLVCGCASVSSAGRGPASVVAVNGLMVLTTDFGLKDGAVSEIKGVAYGVSKQLVISDLSHEIPPYNIWEAAYRLQQTYKYWPPGTVFVTVVDPGVGSARRSLAVRTKSGHYFIGPDNGHLTLVLDEAGTDSARLIDETLMRRKGSEESYTFHGRDLYGYVGARLSSGQLRFEDTGKVADGALVRLQYQKPELRGGRLQGTVPVLDPNYGNVWTNLPKKIVEENFARAKELHVVIAYKGKAVFQGRLPLVDTFASVPEGKPLLYYNSLLNLSAALNKGDFAKKHGVSSGPDWTFSISRAQVP